MNTAQATNLKTIQENTMYLAILEDQDGANKELVAALWEQTLEAKKALAAEGVFVS